MANLAIPIEEMRKAPRVMKRNAAGMGIRVVDPKWIAKRTDELRREAEPRPAQRPDSARQSSKPKRQERPDLVIREMAKAFALPEHILRSRDQDYINEAVYQTAKALRYRCQHLTLEDIAQLLGYADRTSISRLLSQAEKERA